MHTTATIIANCFGLLLQVHNHNDATRHIFPHKITGYSTNNQNRPVLTIFFHMNARPVTYVITYIYGASTHAIAQCISGTAMYNHRTTIHGVGGCILDVPLYHNIGAIHKNGQVVAGDPLNYDLPLTLDGIANISL